MAEFEDKLNAILSSPESMQQVAQLAQMLSGQAASGEATSASQAAAEPTADQPPDLSVLLGGGDLSAVAQFLPLLQSLNSAENSARADLLHALRPFLRPERQAKIDSALQLAHLIHIGKAFLKGFGETHV